LICGHGRPSFLVCTQTGELGRSGLGGLKSKPAGRTAAAEVFLLVNLNRG
jgi:hypothetical protein